MRTVPRPGDTVIDVFDSLLADWSDHQDLQTKCVSIRARIEALGFGFDAFAQGSDFHIIAPRESMASNGTHVVTKEDFKWLYSYCLVKKNRTLYAQLRGAASLNMCPLCGQREVDTLDHYLPQATHAVFSVHPRNLIPACGACNKAKLAHVATKKADLTLHPYFDDLSTLHWLFASVEASAPPVVSFRVAPPQGTPSLIVERLRTHMRIFGLCGLFSTHAAEELAAIKQRLLRLKAQAGLQAVRAYLDEEAQSRLAVRLNWWQAAMYLALSESQWFLEEGVHLIR